MLFLLICKKCSWTELWTFAFSQSGCAEAWENQTASPCFREGSWTQTELLLCDQRSEQDGQRAFSHVGYFLQVCSMIFQLAFVNETSSPNWWQNISGKISHKFCHLPSWKGLRKKSLLTQRVDGIKEINLGLVKCVQDLQRHVDALHRKAFHRKISVPGKSDEDGSSLLGLKGHISSFNPCTKKATLGSYCRVASGNPMLIYFLTDQWFSCTWSWKRVKWVTFLLFCSK